MSIQFSFGSALRRSAALLGFLCCLVAQGTLASQAAPAQPNLGAGQWANLNNADVLPRISVLAGTSQSDALKLSGSDSVLTLPLEIGLMDDNVALEDSIEMVRVAGQQRAFGLDQVRIGLKVASKITRNPRPSISPPLLV